MLTALALGAVPPPRRTSAESITGWGYAAAASATVLILAGAARADADTMRLLYGNVLAVSSLHVAILVAVALSIFALHAVCADRFLLVTFDPEGARVAGVGTGAWQLCLNLSIGVAVATAVHEVGALLTFSLLILAPISSLLVARSMRATFVGSAAVGLVAVTLALAGAYYLDLPPGPLAVAILAAAVAVSALAGRGG